jgi:hypothetical protein
LFCNTNHFSILFLLFFVVFTAPQAFATIDADVTIPSIIVNPASIDLSCTNPILSGGTIVTGNVIDIDDSILFDSIDITKSGLVCNGFSLNKISTGALTDLTTYYVRLTVSTDDSSDSIVTDSFVQPKSNAAILVLDDIGAGPITIQFRDILVTEGIEPKIDMPPLFPFETGTLTITDHNANADLSKKEQISIQLNGLETTIDEASENAGTFQHLFVAGDSVSYDPGTLGLARATISLNFDPDPEVGLSLVPFETSDRFFDDNGSTEYDLLELIYKDLDDDGFVSNGDIRLANAVILGNIDGTIVDDTVDFDIGLPLSPFVAGEKHEDSGFTATVFDLGETIYKDLDGDDFVSEGDSRLANSQSQGFFDGSTVFANDLLGTGDIIIEDIILDAAQLGGSEGFVPVNHPVSITFADGGRTLAGSNVVVTISHADFVSNDASLLQMYYQGPGLAYGSITTTAVIDPSSHDLVAKTVVSNPTFDAGFGPLYNDGTGLPLPTIQGNYVLGFDVGSGGGGTGAISKGGFVVNALGALKDFGGSGGGNSPPSFGQSSFAILSGGEEGFGGILNDNDAKTLEETKTFKVGEKAVLRFDFTEGGGIGKIEHIGLYTNVRDGQKRQDSDAYIFYDPLKSPQVTIHDPNGLFSEANFELLQKDATHFVLKFDLTFAKPMIKSDLILESWNLQKWSTINKIPNAIEVVSSGIVQQSTTSEPIVDTFVEDVVNDRVIPVWVKTNAKWWSDDTIDNENFISGIEYLVNEGIIKVTLPDSDDNPSISELQPWIKNTAGWWADDMISNDEFLNAIEWLISNNIIQVV